MHFNTRYFIYTCVLLITEVLIALYVRDAFIRPYVGDVLVVMLLYYCIRAFFKIRVFPAATLVLLFAFIIEWLQYLDFIHLIGLEHNHFFNIVLGTSFSREDLLCYCLGWLIVLLLERKSKKTTLLKA